jgi:hypothetical protein
MADKPLITTGVDVTFDTPTILKAAGLFIAIAVLMAVASHITSKVLGK